VVFVYALIKNLRVMDRWLERPALLVFPVIDPKKMVNPYVATGTAG
jgi:hypothetical protein